MAMYEIKTKNGETYQVETEEQKVSSENASSSSFLPKSVQDLTRNTSLPERAMTFSEGGGLPAAVAGVSPKAVPESYQLIGQALGGFAGGFPGAVIGETAGDLMKQGVNQALYNGPQVSLQQTALNTGSTALNEALFRTAGKFAFGKAPAIEALGENSKVLGQMKQALSNRSILTDQVTGNQYPHPELSVSKERMVNLLDDTLNNLKGARGKVAATLRQWRNMFASSEHDTIPAKDLIRFESLLNEQLNFKPIEIFGFKIQQPVVDRELQTAAKGIRSTVSDMVDSLAEKAGIPAFKAISQKVASLIKATSGREGLRALIPLIAKEAILAPSAYTLGKESHNPWLGAAAFVGPHVITNPAVQAAMYKGFGKSGIGKASTLASSELVRKITNQYNQPPG